MKTRIIISIVLLPLFLGVVLGLPTVATACLIAAMSVIGIWELLHTTKLVQNMRLIIYAMLMGVAITFWSYYNCPYGLGLIMVLVFFLALFAELLASHAKLSLQSICITAFAALVIPFALSSIVRILLMEYGKYYVMVAFILAFVADSGAYFAGRFLGKHKLAPIISPKKTIEGAIGGIISAILFMLAYGLILQYGFDLRINYGFAVIFGVLGSIGSVVGDLTFSVIKRQVEIKDYGKLIPGHGGILDRFDSMIIVAPLTEALILTFPLIVI